MRGSEAIEAVHEKPWAVAVAMAAALVITGCESTIAGTTVKPTDRVNDDGVTLGRSTPEATRNGCAAEPYAQ